MGVGALATGAGAEALLAGAEALAAGAEAAPLALLALAAGAVALSPPPPPQAPSRVNKAPSKGAARAGRREGMVGSLDVCHAGQIRQRACRRRRPGKAWNRGAKVIHSCGPIQPLPRVVVSKPLP
jgi:hypothetical protein